MHQRTRVTVKRFVPRRARYLIRPSGIPSDPAVGLAPSGLPFGPGLVLVPPFGWCSFGAQSLRPSGRVSRLLVSRPSCGISLRVHRPSRCHLRSSVVSRILPVVTGTSWLPFGSQRGTAHRRSSNLPERQHLRVSRRPRPLRRLSAVLARPVRVCGHWARGLSSYRDLPCRRNDGRL